MHNSSLTTCAEAHHLHMDDNDDGGGDIDNDDSSEQLQPLYYQ